MAICQTCKAETSRVRTHWTEDGSQFDECSQCAPGSFEKFTAPSDKKIWMGYEAHPNEYIKAGDGGYDRKPEYRAEQEAKLTDLTEDERKAQSRAIAKKRATRRTEPMTEAELISAKNQLAQIGEWMRGVN